MLRSVLKSVLHNVFVVAVGFVVALLGAGIDHLLGIADFKPLRIGLVVRLLPQASCCGHGLHSTFTCAAWT
jgi:hypothetical protein